MIVELRPEVASLVYPGGVPSDDLGIDVVHSNERHGLMMRVAAPQSREILARLCVHKRLTSDVCLSRLLDVAVDRLSAALRVYNDLRATRPTHEP